jgi:BlaI family penicillinase repressor
MATRKKPTNAELAILRVLWARGPSTVREAADALQRQDAYTTVLKQLQIMTVKGLVRRDESSRTHVYRAMYSEDRTRQQIVGDLLNRLFDGSAASLVMHVLSARRPSDDELLEIQRLIDAHRGRS